MSEGDGLGGNKRPQEQPRCATCGHRRIFHTRTAAELRQYPSGYRRHVIGEEFVPCSLADCPCREYVPSLPGANGLGSRRDVR